MKTRRLSGLELFSPFYLYSKAMVRNQNSWKFSRDVLSFYLPEHSQEKSNSKHNKLSSLKHLTQFLKRICESFIRTKVRQTLKRRLDKNSRRRYVELTTVVCLSIIFHDTFACITSFLCK